jgi:hypothetical protein
MKRRPLTARDREALAAVYRVPDMRAVSKLSRAVSEATPGHVAGSLVGFLLSMLPRPVELEIDGEKVTVGREEGMALASLELAQVADKEAARLRFLRAYPLPHPAGCFCIVCVDARAAEKAGERG